MEELAVPKYRVKVTYDMGMSGGQETHQFTAKNDNEARKYVKSLKGSDLSPIKRDVRTVSGTFSRVL